jgi:hypothetical protein
MVVCGRYETNSKSVEVIPCPVRPSEADASKGNIKIISREPTLMGKNAEDVVTKAE